MKRLISIMMALCMLLGMSGLTSLAEWSDTDDRCPHREWSSWQVTRKATCTKSGRKERTCLMCGKEKTKKISALGHDWGSWKVTKEPTCTASGSKRKVCSRCGEKETEKLPASDHSWGEWYVIAEPTGHELGVKESVCESCGEKKHEAFYPDGTLKQNDRGDAVKELQKALNDAGYDCGKPDGKYGGKTIEAVKQLEKDNGMEPDGVAWPDVQQLPGIATGKTEPEKNEEGEKTGTPETEPEKTGEGESEKTGEGEEETGITEVEPEKENEKTGEGETEKTGEDEEIGIIEVVPETQPEEPSSAITLETAGSIAGMVGDLNDKLEIELLVTDTGETVVSLETASIGDGEGNGAPSMTSAKFTEPSSYRLSPAGTMAVTLMVTVLPSDIEHGSIVRTVSINGSVWGDAATGLAATDASAATIKGHGIVISNELRVEVPIADQTEKEPVRLLKRAMNELNEGSDEYHVGDTVRYEITLVNGSDEALTDVELGDPLKGSNEDAIIDRIEALAAGESYSAWYAYTVKPSDLDTGWVDNVATAVWNGGEICSEIATVFIVEQPDPDPDSDPEPRTELKGLTVTKTVRNTPANGAYFTEGETVEFEIAIVNTNDTELENGRLYDLLESGEQPIRTYPVIGGGYTDTVIYPYTVTEADAVNGSVLNTVRLVARDHRGNVIVATDEVEAITGRDTPDRTVEVHPALTITKKETSTPPNGKGYYEENDRIEYEITYTNVGDTTLSLLTIYDSLEGGTGEIDSRASLDPGESATVPYKYQVTDKDVDHKKVRNAACAAFYGDGELMVEVSNEVVSPTDRETPDDDEHDPHIDLPLPGSMCRRTLLVRTDAGYEYRLEYCDTHMSTQRNVEAMLEGAGTPEEKQKAWQLARELWHEDILTMYGDLMAAANTEAKPIILKEQLLFEAQVAMREQALNAQYPDQPEKVAEELAELMMDRCVDMCYELHTAPEARVDRLLAVELTEGEASGNAECVRTIEPQSDGSVRYAEQPDHAHALTCALTNAMAAQDASADTWSSIRRMWSLEAAASYARSADPEVAKAIAADRDAFERWLDARAELLALMYDAPEVVSEVIARQLKDRVLDNCGGMR